MARFEGSYTQSLVLATGLASAKAHFADLATIAANTGDLLSHEREGDVLHFVLKAQDHVGVVKFQGDYRCRYTLAGDTLTWAPVSGNVKQSGEARFRALPDGQTALDYRETVEVDMDVPAMMAPLLAPLIGPMLTHEIKGYVGRMVASLR